MDPRERIDDLNRRGYRLIQRTDRFCFGTDAVLLAWFSALKPGDRVMDLCSGNGIVPMLMAARREKDDVTFFGLEIQETEVELAVRSARLNHCSDRMTFTLGDVKRAAELFRKQSFDVVTCNPPYVKKGSGILHPEDPKAIARHEIGCTLKDVCKAGTDLLKPSGKFYMVHRPARFREILEYFREGHTEVSRVRFVHPYEDREAALVLVEGIKNASPDLKVEPPLIIYHQDGSMTDTAKAIYGEETG